MSGMEVVAIIGCVAAVVSAYKDGERIVKRIKERRAAKKALAPTGALESSLAKGPLAVEKARDEGLEEYGRTYARGDSIAIEALRDIENRLLRAVVKHLGAAQEDDSVMDFAVLVKASDLGRIQSVTVLMELYMRMAEAAPVQRTLPSPTRAETIDSTVSSKSPWNTQKERVEEVLDTSLYEAQTNHGWTTSPRETSSQVHSDISEPSEHRGKSKYFLPWRSKRDVAHGRKASEPLSAIESSNSSEGTSGPNPGNSNCDILSGEKDMVVVPVQEPSMCFNGTSSPDRKRSLNDHRPESSAHNGLMPEVMMSEGNPWESEISMSRPSFNSSEYLTTGQTMARPLRPPPKPIQVDKGPIDSHVIDLETKSYLSSPCTPRFTRAEAQSQAEPTTEESKALHRKSYNMPWGRFFPEGNSLTKAVTTSEAMPEASRITSRTQSLAERSGSVTSANSYGGFCKGAYKLQVGLVKESVKLNNQSTSMTGESRYWACASSKCAFEGPALRQGKSWMFDNKLRRSHALQYRWTLLAKSHVSLSKVKKREHSYKCIFCEIQGKMSEVYPSEACFIEHVMVHRGQDPTELATNKLCCIAGREAGKEESFDVNFIPLVPDS
ncbi:hypothetical protein ACLMJK_005442 [Lecanora helva]